MKTMELSRIGLTDISSPELQDVHGGYTTMAYDVGTLLRTGTQTIIGDYKGAVKTFFNWFLS